MATKRKASTEPRVSRKTPVGQAEDLAKKVRANLLALRDELGMPRNAMVEHSIDAIETQALLLEGIDARDSEIEKQFRERFGLQPKR